MCVGNKSITSIRKRQVLVTQIERKIQREQLLYCGKGILYNS